MICRQVSAAIIALIIQTCASTAQSGIVGPANNILQPLGSMVTSRQMTPDPIIINTSPISSPQAQTDPNYNPPRSATNPLSAPIIAGGLPKPPPPGLTGGTVCQNNVCSLSPVPVQPTTTATAAPVTPRYPPGYTGNTFASPVSAPAPQGVSVGVTPSGREADMSKTRADVLRTLGNP
jgi:hypothetical protein